MKIYRCVLLELPILIFVNNKNVLCATVSGLMGMIYPFRYKYPVCAVLPTNCYSMIETYDSFIFGINEIYHESFFSNNNIDERRSYIIADVLSETVTIKYGTQGIERDIYINDERNKLLNDTIKEVFEKAEYPEHYKRKISSKLYSISLEAKEKTTPKKPDDKKNPDGKNSKNNKANKNPQKSEENEDTSAEQKPSSVDYFTEPAMFEFFYFLVSLFKDYLRYCKFEDEKVNLFDKLFYTTKGKNISLDLIINIQDYITLLMNNNYSFRENKTLFTTYAGFSILNTEMFKDFMMRKIYPRTLEEKLSFLYFDERIRAKKNKKFFSFRVQTPFLDNKQINPEKTVKVDVKKPADFSKNEYAYLSLEKSRERALEYFQDIETHYSNEKECQLIFSYSVFPKLLYDNIPIDLLDGGPS